MPAMLGRSVAHAAASPLAFNAAAWLALRAESIVSGLAPSEASERRRASIFQYMVQLLSPVLSSESVSRPRNTRSLVGGN